MFGDLHRFQQHRSYRNEKHGTGKKSSSLYEQFQGVFQLQRDHRQSYTTPHIYKGTRPARYFWGPSGDSNLQTHAWELGVVTTRPPFGANVRVNLYIWDNIYTRQKTSFQISLKTTCQNNRLFYSTHVDTQSEYLKCKLVRYYKSYNSKMPLP